MGRIHQILCFVLIMASMALAQAVSARPAEKPQELVLDEDAIIDVVIGGIPLRMKVDPGLTGQPIIDPQVAIQLKLRPEARKTYDFGADQVEAVIAQRQIDFGPYKKSRSLVWSRRKVMAGVDGVIGVHDLPYRKVTFKLGQPSPDERVHQFKLIKRDAPRQTRLGTYLKVGEKRMFVIFWLGSEANLISAPSANFVATYQQGVFVPGTDRRVEMLFGLGRETREMRLDYPLVFGDLVIDKFAVRLIDYGRPKKVGDVETVRPKNTAQNILVGRRKGSGRPDLLTRIGRGQLARCSRLSYDLKQMQGELSCAPD